MNRLLIKYLALFWGVLGLTQSLGAHTDRLLSVATFSVSPYVSRDEDSPGFVYEIAAAAFAKANYTLDPRFLPAPRARNLVETGYYEVLLPTFPSSTMSEPLLYSDEIYESRTSIVELKNNPSDKAPRASRQGDADLGLRLRTDKTLQLFDMLNKNRIKSMEVDSLVAAETLIERRPTMIGHLRFKPGLQNAGSLRLAVSKKAIGAAKILEGFNKGLAEIKKNGEYQRILEKYGYQTYPNADKSLKIATLKNEATKQLIELTKTEFLPKRGGGGGGGGAGLGVHWFEMDYNQLLRRIAVSRVLEDGAFDLIAVGSGELRELVATNAIMALPDPEKNFRTNDLIPEVGTTLLQNKTYYTVPFRSEVTLTYYRKDVFEKHKIKMPDKPTYQDIEKLAQIIHDPKNKFYGLCLKGKPGSIENMSTFLTFAGSKIPEAFLDISRGDITDKDWIEVVDTYTRLLKKYGPKHPELYGYEEMKNYFREGHCGIWVDMSSAASFLYDPAYSKVSGKIAVAPSPVFGENPYYRWRNTWGFGITTSSLKKDESLEFLRWMASEQFTEALAKKYGWIHAQAGFRASLYKNPAYLKAAPFADRVLNDLTHYVLPTSETLKVSKENWRTLLRMWPAIGTVMGKELALAVAGEKTSIEALTAAQKEIKQLLYQSKSLDHKAQEEPPPPDVSN